MVCHSISRFLRHSRRIDYFQGTFSRLLLRASLQHLGEHLSPVPALSQKARWSSSTSQDPRKKGQSNLDYCVQLVRKNDYENYLSVMLLPKPIQRAAFALRAFNVELALIQGSVSDKNIGLMRLQFWKDTIERIYKAIPPEAPVPFELAGTCGYYKLSKRWLDRTVEARTIEMQRNNFSTVSNVEEHAEHINSSLYYLLLECMGVRDVQADHAASHLGKAQGLVTLVRATPHHAQNRRVHLPLETLAKHNVSQEDIIRGKDSQPVKDAMFDLASLAHQHLEKARSLKSSLPDKSYLVFLNATVCDLYLKALQKADFNVFDRILQQKYPLLPYHLYMNKLKKRF